MFPKEEEPSYNSLAFFMPIKLEELYFFCLMCYIEELKYRGLTYIKEAIMINKNTLNRTTQLKNLIIYKRTFK
ncbi:hypothetical protein A7H1H_2230 [Aliarcobacter butzleri 7h1h]|nr:hypothetical protein A7H1H_2230 [Aliarcobacter butzleri 7h1h]